MNNVLFSLQLSSFAAADAASMLIFLYCYIITYFCVTLSLIFIYIKCFTQYKNPLGSPPKKRNKKMNEDASMQNGDDLSAYFLDMKIFRILFF